MSGGVNSIDAVKKKIKVLQEQAEEAEDRAEKLQREVEKEKKSREEVRVPLGFQLFSIKNCLKPQTEYKTTHF